MALRVRKTAKQKRCNKERETNEKFLKNLSDHRLTNSQVSILSKELRLIPTPMTNENEIKRHLLADFEQFARRMRLQYIFHGNHAGKHPFHVKSNWIPPVQPSVALESYLENVKVRLAEITTQKPKYNLSRKEHIGITDTVPQCLGLNLCLIIAKYYIYTASKNEEDYFFDAFLSILKNKIQIETSKAKVQVKL